MEQYLSGKARRPHRWHIPVGIFSGSLGALAIEVCVEDFPGGDLVISLLAYALTLGLVLLPGILVLMWRVRRHVARRFAAFFASCPDAVFPLGHLSRMTHVRRAPVWLRTLINKGFLQNVGIDGGFVRLAGKTAAEPPRQAAGRETDDILLRIRRLNDDIDNETVSAHIDRIEELTAGIFRLIQDRPERADAARKFINYYLPTTFRLLEAYSLMEKQTYQGENIRLSRQSIEDVLTKIIQAIERQQDRMFQSDAMDVESEIRVLETMMSADGLAAQREGTVVRAGGR